jgi:hypothetical protein
MKKNLTDLTLNITIEIKYQSFPTNVAYRVPRFDRTNLFHS